MNVIVCLNANCFQVYETHASGDRACGACGSPAVRVHLDDHQGGCVAGLRNGDTSSLQRINIEANR